MIPETDAGHLRLVAVALYEYSNDLCARSMFMKRPSVMLGLVPKPDGNQWCVLYGANPMEGVIGFGDTPDKAMQDFDKNWYTERAGVPDAK